MADKYIQYIYRNENIFSPSSDTIKIGLAREHGYILERLVLYSWIEATQVDARIGSANAGRPPSCRSSIVGCGCACSSSVPRCLLRCCSIKASGSAAWQSSNSLIACDIIGYWSTYLAWEHGKIQ